MHDCVAKLHDLLLEQKHEQGTTFRYLVVGIAIVGSISDIIELCRELRTGQTVYRIDHDLQRLCK